MGNWGVCITGLLRSLLRPLLPQLLVLLEQLADTRNRSIGAVIRVLVVASDASHVEDFERAFAHQRNLAVAEHQCLDQLPLRNARLIVVGQRR